MNKLIFEHFIPEDRKWFRDVAIRDKMREVFLFLHKRSDMQFETEADRFLYNFLYFMYGKEMKL